ncbi:hypothetical protein Tco_1007675 [Tanacetum coccineum]
MISCMTQLMEASGQTYQAFDEILEVAPQLFSRDAPDKGLARPALPQLPSSQTHDPSIPYLLILSSKHLHYLIKPGSKFSIVVREYVTRTKQGIQIKSRIKKRE